MARMTYALEILSLGLSPAWSDYNILRNTILLDAKQAHSPGSTFKTRCVLVAFAS